MIKFSFIIPTRNEEKYIGGCLASIKKQSRKDYEIIVSDTLSKDKTRYIAKKYRAVVITEKRRGPGVARNTGAKRAKGKILIFADADSRFEKNFLDDLEKVFENDIGGCVFKQDLFDGNRGDVFYLKMWNSFIKFVNSIGFTMTNGVCFVYEKNVFNKEHGFNIKLLTNEDHDLARRVAKHKRFVFVDDITVKTSKRRAKKLGMKRFFLTQVKATLFYFLNHRSFSGYWQ